MKEQAALGGAGMVGLWRLMEQEEHDEGTFPVSGAMEVSRVRTCTAHGFSLSERLLLSGTVLIAMKCCAVSGSGLVRPCSAQPQSEPEPAGCGQSAVCQPEIGLYLPVSRHKDQLSPTPSSASSPVTVVSWTLVGVHAPPLEDARKHQGDGCPRVYQGQVGSTNQGCSPDTGL